MNFLSAILSDILVFEIEANDGALSTRTSTAKYTLKGSAIVVREIDNEKYDWARKKDRIAVVVITGSDVGSKEFDMSSRDVAAKITDNDNLLWTLHEGKDYARIDFIRKSSLASGLKEIEDKGVYIADSIVSRQTGIDINRVLQGFYEKKINFNHIKTSPKFRAFFFDRLFDRIKLPVLLFFLVLLFANYLIFSNINEKYNVSETAYNIQLQKNKQETENSEKAGRLFDEYNKIPAYPLALISDRIASYVPRNLLLTSMVFFPEKTSVARSKAVNEAGNVIVIKGRSEIAGTVLLFTQYLQEDKLFKKVDVVNIDNLKDNESYDFEVRILL